MAVVRFMKPDFQIATLKKPTGGRSYEATTLGWYHGMRPSAPNIFYSFTLITLREAKGGKVILGYRREVTRVTER